MNLQEIKNDDNNQKLKIKKCKIVFRAGFKFRQMDPKKRKLTQACIVDDCINSTDFSHSIYYCFDHFNKITDVEKSINELNKKFGILKTGDRFITIKNGFKYTLDKEGIYRLICCCEDCNKLASPASSFHCVGHYNKLEDKHETITNLKKKLNDNISENTKKKIEELEKTSKIINGVKIYFKNGKKYRMNPKGDKLIYVCMYNNCVKYTDKDFCKGHKNGTDPNSPERIEEYKNRKIKMKESCENNNKLGESSEEWVYHILSLFTTINSIEQIGHIKHKLDIIYKINNENFYRGIQVKTLSKDKHRYRLNLHNQTYDDDTLIVGVYKNKKTYTLCFYKDFKNKKSLSFSLGSKSNSEFIYNSSLKFLTDFEKFLQNSTTYKKDDITKYDIQERNQLDRLQIRCNNMDITYKINKKINAVDCFINYYNIQCKSSNCIATDNNYKFGICKNYPKKPYSDKDNIDFFICEIVKYPNNFFIIPIKILIEKGYITTDNQIGKLYILLPSPISKLSHWATKYLNRFDLLKKNYIYDHLNFILEKAGLNKL